jgi:predicted PurR-regulated permease PerM
MTIASYPIIKKLLVIFLIFAGLHFAENFLMPLTIGIVLATLFLPYSQWLEEKKVPKILAVFICLFILLIVIAGIASLIGWQIFELSKDFELIKDKSIQLFSGVQEFIFDNIGIPIEKQNQILRSQESLITGFIQSIASSMSSVIVYLILILVYVLFLLYYRDHIKSFLLKLSPPSQRNEMEKVISLVTKVSQQYLQGLSKMIFFLWIMYGIGFSALGIKNAIFFAILCGLLEIVPFVGNITGVSITLLVAAVQ